MEKVLPNHGAPPVPSWFPEELKTIDPNFKLLWMPEAHKFAIVSPAPPSVFRPEGYVVEAIIHQEDRYKEPDMAVIHELRRLMREKEKTGEETADSELKRIREEDEARAEKAENLRWAMQWDFMKKVYHFLHRKTFVFPEKKKEV